MEIQLKRAEPLFIMYVYMYVCIYTYYTLCTHART